MVFATSAGVDQFDLSTLPEHVDVVRMLDPGIARGIVEYVCFAVLSLHREMPCISTCNAKSSGKPGL